MSVWHDVYDVYAIGLYYHVMYYEYLWSCVRHVEATFDMLLVAVRHVASTCCWCGRGLITDEMSNLVTWGNERIKCKLLSLTYKVLTTNQPQYLHDSISVQPCHNTRSSSMVTLARPPIPTRLWKSQIAPLGMLHPLYGMNSPLISASRVRHSLLHFLLSHMAFHHLHHLHYHR